MIKFETKIFKMIFNKRIKFLSINRYLIKYLYNEPLTVQKDFNN